MGYAATRLILPGRLLIQDRCRTTHFGRRPRCGNPRLGRCENRRVSSGTVHFRHSQAILVAALIGFFGVLPLAGARWFLAPVLLVPAAVGVWAWRAGTDADPTGLWIRALLSQRHIPWAEIAEFGADRRGRAVARFGDGRSTVLPAVRAADLRRLVAASGQPVTGSGQGDAPPGPG